MTSTSPSTDIDIARAKDLPDKWERLRALRTLAFERRDMDDMVGFDAACEAMMGDCPPRKTLWSPPFNKTFAAMYGLDRMNNPDDALRVLRVKGNEGTRMFALRNPDEFAAVHLQIVQERMNDGGTKGSHWYNEAEILTGTVPSTILGSYLRSLYAVVGTVAGEEPHHTFVRWKEMPEMAAVIKECKSWEGGPMVVHALVEAVRLRQDCMTAFLAMALMHDKEEISPGIARMLTEAGMDASAFPLSQALKDSAEPSPADEARAILALAGCGSSFRHAGRLAANFLQRRSDFEYEEVELDVLNKATFPLPS